MRVCERRSTVTLDTSEVKVKKISCSVSLKHGVHYLGITSRMVRGVIPGSGRQVDTEDNGRVVYVDTVTSPVSGTVRVGGGGMGGLVLCLN